MCERLRNNSELIPQDQSDGVIESMILNPTHDKIHDVHAKSDSKLNQSSEQYIRNV